MHSSLYPYSKCKLKFFINLRINRLQPHQIRPHDPKNYRKYYAKKAGDSTEKNRNLIREVLFEQMVKTRELTKRYCVRK
jgi:CRISPR/Cas system endoribonuclease Cas6 (RAMP superfamily)